MDRYDVYQHLMDYWAEIMQDDVYAIAQDGWKAANVIRELVPAKDKSGKSAYNEDHDFEFGTSKSKRRYKSDIVPPALVIQRYFADKQKRLEELQIHYETATQALENFIEEHSGEDGLVEEAKNDKGKVTQTGIKNRLKETDDEDEIAVLEECLELITAESKCKSAVKTAKDELDELVFKKIPAIPEGEIKEIVIRDKWLAAIDAAVNAEIERVTQTLAGRVKALEERYADPLPKLSAEVAELSQRVDEHLKRMGLAWAS